MQSQGSKFTGFFKGFSQNLKSDEDKLPEVEQEKEEKEEEEEKVKKVEKAQKAGKEQEEEEEEEEEDKSSESEEIMAESVIHNTLHPKCEAGLNKQINLECQAGYTYGSMATHFDSDDVALHGFSKFFKKCGEDKKGRVEMIVKYINKRGGTVIFEDIPKPSVDRWGTGLDAMVTACDMEHHINENLLHLHKLARIHVGPQLQTFVEILLNEQVEAIKLLADHVTNLRRVGSGLGEYLFGRHTLAVDQDTSDDDED